MYSLIAGTLNEASQSNAKGNLPRQSRLPSKWSCEQVIEAGMNNVAGDAAVWNARGI